MNIRTEKVIECSDWDKTVMETYGKPYSFQQQNGCQDRGSFRFTVPDNDDDEEMNDTVPEIVNDDQMGVKFAVWKARDPKTPLKSDEEHIRSEQWAIDLWWDRNFYPDFQTVANDLHAKGLLEAGDYAINIDW